MAIDQRIENAGLPQRYPVQISPQKDRPWSKKGGGTTFIVADPGEWLRACTQDGLKHHNLCAKWKESVETGRKAVKPDFDSGWNVSGRFHGNEMKQFHETQCP